MPYLTAAGERLEYQWIGPGPGERPTLVFLHEGLGCVGMWRDFPARVAAATGCGALVYSRCGYGDSEPLPRPRTSRYLHHEALAVLPQVLAVVAIERSILIGHSDGASIALIYAGATASPKTLGLVLEAPHVFVEDVTIEGIKRTGELYRTTDLGERLARYHGDQTNAVFWGWHDTWLEPGFRDWNIEEYLARIRCPVLVIQGEDDEYGTKRQVDAIASQASEPVAALMLAAYGHTPHRDQSEAVFQAIDRFMRDVIKESA